MADFSKEYCEKHDPDFPYDFSIIEEFKKLKTGFVKPIICEGYGFIGIVNQNDELKLLYPVGYDGDFKLVNYEDIDK